MLFRQSAVSALTRDTITEEADRLPLDIYPALIGSGELGLGLDATGLQGLNARTRQYRDTASLMFNGTATQDDLCLRRDGACSQHDLACEPLWNPATNYLLLPCGWLDYTLTIDGDTYSTARLAAEGTRWRRTFSPLTGMVETRFRLGQVEIAWQAGLAPDRVEVELLCEAAVLDGRARRIGLEVRCHQTTRGGTPLATGGMAADCDGGMAFRSWEASTATSTAPLLEPIRLGWALIAHGEATYTADEHHLAARCAGEGTAVVFGLRLIAGSDRDGTHTRERAGVRAAAYRRAEARAALDEVAAQWRSFFAQAADISIGDPAKEFLVLQSQYVLRAGAGWRNGVPMSTLWTGAILPATYWDSFFAADGMLRCGHLALVRALGAWLVRTARPQGRPHYWMTYANGVSVATDDQAYQVSLAFGGIVIRLYQCSRDRADLERISYPYLRRVAEFAFAEILVQDATGWHLHGEVAHDVNTTTSGAERHPGMLLWVATCVAKCAEYASLLGLDDALIAKCRDVDRHFRAHRIDLSDPGMWDTWLPFVTAAEPLADYESWWRHTRAKLAETPARFYYFQPWANFTIAASLSLTGHPDLALEVQRDGLNSISGLGYIDEVTYEAHGGGWAPFPTSVGPWLSSSLIPFAHGSLWDDEVQVGVLLPRRFANQYLRWRNVTTVNGARVSGTYDPHHLDAEVETDRARYVRLRVPARIVGEPLLVRANAQPALFTATGDTIVVWVTAGTHRLVIERDLAAPAEVIVAEPFDHGRQLAELVARSDRTVRWLRDHETLKILAGGAKAVVVHVSYAALPVDVVAALEASVRRGLVLVTCFHGGCTNVDRAMAELTGVRALFDGSEREYWSNTSSQRTYELTDAGRRRLPGLESTLHLPASGKFKPRLAADTEILATERESGNAVVTCRRLGQGQACWLAAGGKTMDFGVIDQIHGSGRDLWLFGEDSQDRPDLKWLKSPDWQKLLLGLIGG